MTTDWDSLENELTDLIYFLVDLLKALARLTKGLTKAAANGIGLGK